MKNLLKFDIEYSDEILYIRLHGKLIKKAYLKINNYIIPAIKKHNIKYIIYNLENLYDIDEAGVDALLKTKLLVKNNGGRIIACGCSNEVLEKIKRLKIKVVETERNGKLIIKVNM